MWKVTEKPLYDVCCSPSVLMLAITGSGQGLEACGVMAENRLLRQELSKRKISDIRYIRYQIRSKL
jgi:hypothetical protein